MKNNTGWNQRVAGWERFIHQAIAAEMRGKEFANEKQKVLRDESSRIVPYLGRMSRVQRGS